MKKALSLQPASIDALFVTRVINKVNVSTELDSLNANFATTLDVSIFERENMSTEREREGEPLTNYVLNPG